MYPTPPPHLAAACPPNFRASPGVASRRGAIGRGTSWRRGGARPWPGVTGDEKWRLNQVGLSENSVPHFPNSFADHYPY